MILMPASLMGSGETGGATASKDCSCGVEDNREDRLSDRLIYRYV
jgi:hypothetical protein